MKKIVNIILFLICVAASAQIANYNQFPALPPAHILDDDDLTQDISFAYSLRLLRSDYEGPLIRLRIAGTSTEMDFYCGSDDRVDLDAINTFRGTNDVFVTVWYDQSALGINAIQTIQNRQPQFIPDATQPYFVGDGINDLLVVQETIGNVTNNGAEATITGVFWASNRADSAFGCSGGCNNRWYSHLNWSNGSLFWDPGTCNSARSFANPVPTAAAPNNRLEAWGQYSYIRRDVATSTTTDRSIVRLQGVERLNTGFPQGERYTNTIFRFGICAPVNDAGGGGALHSTTRFEEMIMYKLGKTDAFVQEIEENQIAFWNL